MGEVTALDKAKAIQATVIPLGKTVERHPDPNAPATPERKPIEPTIHALRRILGTVVKDIFPEEFADAVEAGYRFWEANPSSYLDTLFDSAQERDDSLICMRAYAEIAGPNGDGYTIATRSHDNPAMLVWRAQTRRGQGKVALDK